MRAVILAAGQGQRLLPHTLDRPKCCLDIGGTTPIRLMRDSLRLVGIHELVVVVGHRSEVVVRELGPGPTYVSNLEFKATNSLHSLLLAAPWFDGGGLVLNGDVIVDPDSLQALIEAPVSNALLYERRNEFDPEEMKLALDETGRLLTISKALDPMDADGENLGILRLSRSAMHGVFAHARMLSERGERNHWVPHGLDAIAGRMPIHCVEIGGRPWIEMDFPEDLDRARSEIVPAIRDRVKASA